MKKTKKGRTSTSEVLVRFWKETKKGKYTPIDAHTVAIGRVQEERQSIEEIGDSYYITFA